MTIFVGVLSLDNGRIKNKRADIICCCVKISNPKEPRQEIVRAGFQKHFVPLIFTKPAKIVILSTTVTLITLGVMSCYEIVLGLN